jgi:hypothetical protein
MPPRACTPIKRALHFPSAGPSVPRPRVNQASFTHPKPHLASYHFDQKHPSFDDYVSPPTPSAPRLPARRQPAFNPGGFGLQAAPTPLGVEMDKGKHRAFDEIEADEGKKEGKEEAEACYVVSLDASMFIPASTRNSVLSIFPSATSPVLAQPSSSFYHCV